MSRTVVNEPSGTVSPLELRTRIFSTSSVIAAVLGVGLRRDAERAAEQVEVVDVGRAEIDLQRAEHVGHVDAEQLRLGAVDVEIELRRRGLEQREHLLRRPASARRGPSSHRPRPASACGPAAGAVLDHHAEAAGVADARHRRRQHHDHQRFLDRRKLAGTAAPWMPAADWSGSLARFSKSIEHQEHRAGIRRIGEGRAGEADDVDARARRPAPSSAMSTARRCTASVRVERSAGRQLRHDDEIAAIELRDEADRRLCGTRLRPKPMTPA